MNEAVDVEAIAAEATRRVRAGEAVDLVRLLAGIVAPAHALEIGSSAGACLETVRAATPGREPVFLGIDPRPASCRQATVRAAAAPAAAYYYASLLALPGVPHLTRVPALVAALSGQAFDLVVVEPPAGADALYLTLAQALPLLAPQGVLHCGPLDAAGMEVVRRLAAEGAGPAVFWQPAADEPPTALVRGRQPASTHEDTAALCAGLRAADPVLAAAETAGDHAAVCTHLRSWLAARLVWSTRDLLLPLAAVPPPLSVGDVVSRCALHDGGVWAYGAAVTLAMLYRAWGYPATVYQHGIPDLYWHMMTLVRVPDGRILLEDPFFDAAPTLGGAAVPWSVARALARAGHAGRLEFASAADKPRVHLYSRASLATAEADGYLTAAERARLAAAMEGYERVRGEPRAALAQDMTVDLARYASVPANARALAAVRRRTGIAHPLDLLALPCGRLPLSGDPAFDHEIVDVLAEATPPPVAAEA